MLELVGPVPLPIDVRGQHLQAQWYVAVPQRHVGRSQTERHHTCAVVFGDPTLTSMRPLIRIHSTCFTGDVMGSLRCDCGPQLDAALEQMARSPSGGVLVYMAAHEGRGIGLWSKAAAYLLQDEGLDTYEANRALGFQDDQRNYRYASVLIRHLLGDRGFRLLTNNPDKVRQLRALGLQDIVQQPHIAGVGAWNRRYIRAKREHGHRFTASCFVDQSE